MFNENKIIFLPKMTITNSILVFLYSKLMQTFFAISKKNCHRTKRTIYINTFQTNLRHVCLSVTLKFCLSLSVVFVLVPAYTSLCRSLEYLLKVQYTLIVDPLRDRFWVSQQHCPMSEKEYHKSKDLLTYLDMDTFFDFTKKLNISI